MSDAPTLTWLYALAVQGLGVLIFVYLVTLLGLGLLDLGGSAPTAPHPPTSPAATTRGRHPGR